jgi:hypothetical protein
MIKHILSLLFNVVFSIVLFAQPSSPDTAFVSAAIQNSISVYEKVIDGQQLFLNGGSYLITEGAKGEHPFYPTDDWVYGTIDLDGQLFSNIPLLYDITADQVLTESSNGSLLAFPEKKIRRFNMDKNLFVYIENSTVNNRLPKTGFYHFLYNGKTKVIAERRKRMQEEIESLELIRRYEVKYRYFILKNGSYSSVKSKSSILKVLADQKNGLKSFIRKEGISFKTNREQALSRVAEHYDTLKSQLK